MNHIKQITTWIRDAGQSPSGRTSALYLGLCCEELGEALDKLHLPHGLTALSKMLRSGTWDTAVATADHAALLDAALDMMWVATGLAYALGADVEGAMAEIIRSNNSKRTAAGTLEVDATGKVVKGAAYSAPDLRPFFGRHD